MFTRLGKILVVAALVLTTGLHWAALQTVAWTAMLADHLSSQTFSEAVSQTFDGQHLCPLCKAIAAGKKSEQKSEAVAFTLKMEFPPVTAGFILVAPTPISAFCPDALSAPSSFVKPLLPPPRSLFI